MGGGKFFSFHRNDVHPTHPAGHIDKRPLAAMLQVGKLQGFAFDEGEALEGVVDAKRSVLRRNDHKAQMPLVAHDQPAFGHPLQRKLIAHMEPAAIGGHQEMA